jgi:predicted solute-binding protein
LTATLKLGTTPNLNTEPLVWPLEHGVIQHPHSIIRAVPADLVEMLASGQLDCATTSVAAMIDHPDLVPLPDVAIACRGAVASVLLFHNDPLDALTRIWLDPASRTSNLLVRILLSDGSRTRREFVNPSGSDARDIPPVTDLPARTGRLLIGDEALRLGSESSGSPGFTDLGALWKQKTNHPFTFARWLARTGDIGAQLAGMVREARDWSMLHLHEIIDPLAELHHFEPTIVDRYLRQNITYMFGPREEAGMREFFRLADELARHGET